MKKSDNFLQKIFAGLSGGGRIPLRSNVFNSGGGYSTIGQTGSTRGFENDRTSPLLGNAQPSNRISGYYDRISELRGYQLIDITKMAVNLFKDYLVNFLTREARSVVTVLDKEGNNDDNVTNRINNILTEELRIFDFIEDHLDDSIFYGTYCAMLMADRDDTGHLKFRLEELHDPISVITKKKKNPDGIMEEVYLARGEDGKIYEIPRDEAFCLGSPTLRLVNDLADQWASNKGGRSSKSIQPPFGSTTNPGDKYQKGEDENRSRVLKLETYKAGEPLFYSSILKIKELVIKELLISLLSLRDLSSPSLYGLAIDKAVPIETANEFCARTQKMSQNHSELSSFLTAQFDATSFIETALTKNILFFPDYNATLGNKNSLLPLDKLSDKLLELLQTLDSCRQSVLSPLGIPSTIYESTSGSKWAILQQSERANSRVASLMSGIKSSVVDLVGSIYRLLYGEEIDSARIKVHIFEKSTVEYNNQLNQSESINALVQGISGVINLALQTLEQAGNLIEPEKFLSYVQTLIKDIDPSAESLITQETIRDYVELFNMKIAMQKEQLMGSGDMME